MYPAYEDIAKIAANCGGNPRDSVGGAAVYDIVKWDEDSGEIWSTPTLASDVSNRRTYRGNVHEIMSVGTGYATADDIIERLGAYTCPYLDDCPLTRLGNCYAYNDAAWRDNDAYPCEHMRMVKRRIAG